MIKWFPNWNPEGKRNPGGREVPVIDDERDVGTRRDAGELERGEE